uniref:AB hydrolase-1 domain-containing protein n=1 Tax=Heterorhabditis bacteriophora TaxID=37862 RepID=A0A1I7WVH5_HETBA
MSFLQSVGQQIILIEYFILARIMLWDTLSQPVDAGKWLSQSELPGPSWIIWILAAFLVVRFLHVFCSPAVPHVTLLDKSANTAMKELIDGIRMLKEPYHPPFLWGRSGHVQTAAYGLLGHASLRRSFDRRAAVRLNDGTTVTFDIFEPISKHKSGRDVTLALTPGIANSSESNYIRTCVHYAQERGYRCVVLNHLGALSDVKLTGTRIFSYGGTDEIQAMMQYMFAEYSDSLFINIGFSMGGNITTRFLLQIDHEHRYLNFIQFIIVRVNINSHIFRHRIILGLSVGQGYSASVSAPMYHDWENGRRAYNYIITENMKRLLRRNYTQAVVPHVKSGLIDEQVVYA